MIKEDSKNTSKPAFTLIELLVVVAIIGLLAALVIPAIGAAREKGRQSHCRNNMRQFALLLGIYRDDHEHLNPGWLSNLPAPKEMFICKSDSSQGAWGSKPDGVALLSPQFEETDDTESNTTRRTTYGANLSITRCSYMYEFSAATCSWGWQDLANPQLSISDVDANGDGIASWNEVKEYQLRHGDVSHTNELGAPVAYDETSFPVIRCYNHYNTRGLTILCTDTHPNSGCPCNGVPGHQYTGNLTINCAYAGNVFDSGLKWEHPVVK